jgi:hypothetical protein
MTNRKALALAVARSRGAEDDQPLVGGSSCSSTSALNGGLCRSASDFAVVQAWTSFSAPTRHVFAEQLETVDLRECRADVMDLSNELDHALVNRKMKQAKYERLQASLREVALARGTPSATEEKQYLLQQMGAIDEARHAEAKYQAALMSMARRARASYVAAQTEVRSLQRVVLKSTRELARARKYDRQMHSEKDAVVRDLAQLRTNIVRVGQARRHQVRQVRKLRNTDDELMRRAVARETRKIDIARTVAGDLCLEDEEVLQLQSTKQGIVRGVAPSRSQLAAWHHSMQLLCEVSGAKTVEEIVDRFHTQQQMKKELDQQLNNTLQREATAKRTKATLVQMRYDSTPAPKGSNLGQTIDAVQDNFSQLSADLQLLCANHGELEHAVLAAGDMMWRCMHRVDTSVKAIHTTAMGSDGVDRQLLGQMHTVACRRAAELANDRLHRDPLRMLASFASQLTALFEFVKATVPRDDFKKESVPAIDVRLGVFNGRVLIARDENTQADSGTGPIQWTVLE